MKLYTLLLKHILCFLPALLLSGCDTILQYPENDTPKREIIVNVKHEQPWSLLEFEYPWDEVVRHDNSNDIFGIRYIFDIYPAGNTDKRIDRFTIDRSSNRRDDFSTILKLAPGTYDICVWTDSYDTSKPISAGDYFYTTDDFSKMQVSTEPYIGNTERKDALCGKFRIVVKPEGAMAEHLPAEVMLRRPLTAFAFISTDLREFIEEELSRREANNSTTLSEQQQAPDMSTFDFSGYTARLHYTVYHPILFNMFVDKPIDAALDIYFDSEIRLLENNEVLIGFDYFFINGENSSSSISITIYNPQKQAISSAAPVKFHVQRNYATIIRGKFLTSKTSGSIGIQTEFDGDFNYPLK